MLKITQRTLKIILLLAIVCTYCFKSNGQKRSIDYGHIVSVPEGIAFNDTILSLLKVKKDYFKETPKLVYYFNGDCSVCIGAFLYFFKEWQQLGMVIPAFFIASAPNLDILSYYMENANLLPEKSLQFLLLDNGDDVKKYNPYMKGVVNTTYVLLVDEKNKIIESKNPFLMKDAMLKYKETDSDYRLTYRATAIQQPKDSKPPSILDMINKNPQSLVFINGKESSLDKLKEVIGKIEDWSYSKGASAAILYGGKAKNGVFDVRTK